jgi:uncharacterized protein (TIGR03067 family)
MNTLWVPLVGLPVLVVVVGLLLWLKIKQDDRKTRSRLEKLHNKRAKIALHGEQPGDEIVSDISLHDIQGRWRMVSVGRRGKFAPPEVLQASKVIFEIKGEAFAIPHSGTTGRLVLNASHRPVQLDQINDDGDNHKCVVRIRNGELEICQAENGEERPSNFNPNRHDNASLTRFARA